MCMITDKERCTVAEKPVTCYKAMHPIDCNGAMKASEYRFVSEFMVYDYTLGEEYSLEKFEKFPEVNLELGMDLCKRRLRVDKGFHSYAREEDAYNHIRQENSSSLLRLGTNPLVLVMCEIPAGASYWEGDEGGRPGYCSDRIKILAWKPGYEKDWIRCEREPAQSDANLF